MGKKLTDSRLRCKGLTVKYIISFLSDPGVPGVRSMGPDVRPSVPPRLCADLTDVTLADEDSNSIPTDDVNGAIIVNVTMWQCKWCLLVVKLVTNASSGAQNWN